MIRLSNGGAYLINGTEVIEDSASAAEQIQSMTFRMAYRYYSA